MDDDSTKQSSPICVTNPTIRDLRDNIEQLKFRLIKYRNENQTLKRFLRDAKLTVYKQLGQSSVTYQTLLKHGKQYGWKNRLENICALKWRIQELQGHLKQLDGELSTPSEDSRSVSEDRKAFWRLELERRLARQNFEKEISPIVRECNELRKCLDAERSRHKELSKDVNFLKAELQSQLDNNVGDIELAESIEALEDQLQDTLEERKKIHDALAASRSRNQALEAEVLTFKAELETLYVKAKDSSMWVNTTSGKHAKVQEAIEKAKTIVRQNVNRYEKELKYLKSICEDDVKLLDSFQMMMGEKDGFLVTLLKDIAESEKAGVDNSRCSPCSSRTGDGKFKSECSVAKKGKGKEKRSVEEEPKKRGIESPLQELRSDCCKYKVLKDVSRLGSNRLAVVATTQEKVLREITIKVFATARSMREKKVEREKLSGEFRRIQKSLIGKNGTIPNEALPSKNQADEIYIKIYVQKQENEFLRAFLRSIFENKKRDFQFYKTFVTAAKNIFNNPLLEANLLPVNKNDLSEEDGTTARDGGKEVAKTLGNNVAD